MSQLHIPSQRFAQTARAPLAAPVPFHRTANKFPLHYVGFALLCVGAVLFGAAIVHGAHGVIAPLNAALAH